MPGIEEDKTPTLEPEDNPEDKLILHAIRDEGETVRPNEKYNSSDFTYQNQESKTDMSAH